MLERITKLYKAVREIPALPRAIVNLDCQSESDHRLYHDLTKPHPRYRIIRNKSLGVGLLDLRSFKNAEQYFTSVSGKNSAFYYSKRARREGYEFKEIDRNHYIDDIHEINTSLKERQGREMASKYLKKQERFPVEESVRAFGVTKDSKLVAYAWITICGEVAIVGNLLGHGEHLKQGVMYLLLTEIAAEFLTHCPETKYLMYDTFFGASDGLRMFKKRVGFRPYRVAWRRLSKKESEPRSRQ